MPQCINPRCGAVNPFIDHDFCISCENLPYESKKKIRKEHKDFLHEQKVRNAPPTVKEQILKDIEETFYRMDNEQAIEFLKDCIVKLCEE